MRKQELVYAMRITKLADNDYFVDYPFEGMCISGNAESLSEAIELAKSALEFTLFDMYESNEDFPVSDEGQISDFEKNKADNEYITLIATNINAVLEHFGETAVKKMVSIKKYQQYYLKQNNIGLSKYLQDNIDRDIQKA